MLPHVGIFALCVDLDLATVSRARDRLVRLVDHSIISLQFPRTYRDFQSGLFAGQQVCCSFHLIFCCVCVSRILKEGSFGVKR